jgi:hypothetical protein
MVIATGVLLGAALVLGGATALDQKRQQEKAQEQARAIAAAELEQQKKLASQATAPVIENEGVVELQSQASLEDDEILSRSKRNRLRIGRDAPKTSGKSVGTGLSVG